jgi:hypothetical protein
MTLETSQMQSRGVIQEPLLSKEARNFLEGQISAGEFVKRGRERAEQDMDVSALARRASGFVRTAGITTSLGYGIAALVLWATQGPSGAISGLAFSLTSFVAVVIASRRQ